MYSQQAQRSTNTLSNLKNLTHEQSWPTSTSCGANKVASLTADGIVSSILNAGKLDTTLTSGITLYSSKKGI